MTRIGVVHLVRAVNDRQMFTRFLDSYRRYPGSAEHELLIVYKGFDRPEDAQPYETLLTDVPHRILHVSDEGVDINAYFAAANHFDHDYLCFLNSHSEVLDAQWLLKLAHHATRSEVGVAGATGCWEGTAYPPPERRRFRTLKGYVYADLRRRWLNRHFTGFPNPFLRTNAFMLSREGMLTLKCGLRDRFDALVFESGRHGMTNQFLRQNLKVVVVGRNGCAYEWADWQRSQTFRQGEQENLLVGDNRTRDYSEGDADMRLLLASKAWGISPLATQP